MAEAPTFRIKDILDIQGFWVPKSELSRLYCDSLKSDTFRRKTNILHIIFINDFKRF